MLSSASSKTAFGLAHLLHTLRKDIRVIGLTSAANADFVTSLGCYDEVVTYDRVTSLPSNSPVAFVDMAGNSELHATLHRHFGDQMKYSGRIGLTHRSSSPDEPDLPGARPARFFAPGQIRKRAKEWGPGGIDTRFSAAWSGFAPMLDRWLKVTEKAAGRRRCSGFISTRWRAVSRRIRDTSCRWRNRRRLFQRRVCSGSAPRPKEPLTRFGSRKSTSPPPGRGELSSRPNRGRRSDIADGFAPPLFGLFRVAPHRVGFG
jgi:hypothetical protein